MYIYTWVKVRCLDTPPRSRAFRAFPNPSSIHASITCMAVEQACTWTKSLILQLVSTDHLLEKKKALRNLPKNVISVISFWIIAFLAESSCFKDLAGNHGETNRGVIKIANLKQKKGSQKLFSFQNDHSLPFFHPSRYGGPGRVIWGDAWVPWKIMLFFWGDFCLGASAWCPATSLAAASSAKASTCQTRCCSCSSRASTKTASNGIPIHLQRLDDLFWNYGSRGSSSRGGGRWSKHCTTRCRMALTEPTWRRFTKNPWSSSDHWYNIIQ